MNERLIDILSNNDNFKIDFISRGQFNVGDIVYAKRYEKNSDKKKLPVGHREGAYLIINGSNGEYLALYGTSIFPANEKENDYYTLSMKDSGLDKNYYFLYKYAARLKEHLIKRKMFSIDNNELLEVKSRVETIISRSKLLLEVNKELDRYPLLPGDIFISEGVKYLYLDNKDENNIWVLPLVNKKGVEIHYQENIGYIDYSLLQSRELEDSYHRIGFVFGKQLDNILNNVILPKNESKIKDDSRDNIEKVLPKIKKQSRRKKIGILGNDDSVDKINFDYVGMIVKRKDSTKEYIIIYKNSDYIVMLDKNKYINGEYCLEVATQKDIEKVAYVSNKSFLEILKSLQGKYSSYFSFNYIYSLRKVIENS